MAIKSSPCKECGSIFHTKMYHTPRKPLKRTAIKRPDYKEMKDTTNAQMIIVKKPRKKSSPRKIAKDKAWTAFSAYIRTRDCLRFTGDESEGMCITCKKGFPYKQLQAGHFVGGRGNAVLFREDIVYSQCAKCNNKPSQGGLGGNYAAYAFWMQDEGHTREHIEDLLNLRHETLVYKIHDFVEIKAKYETKTKELLDA